MRNSLKITPLVLAEVEVRASGWLLCFSDLQLEAGTTMSVTGSFIFRVTIFFPHTFVILPGCSV